MHVRTNMFGILLRLKNSLGAYTTATEAFLTLLFKRLLFHMPSNHAIKWNNSLLQELF